jgi:hypothetical protein
LNYVAASHRTNKLEAARAWLDRGAELLPIQPGSKKLVAGFGPYRRRVKDLAGARKWWGDRSPYNLAVYCPGDLLALDFDSNQLFLSWQDSLPAALGLTYHEVSRRGWHIFYRCQVPAGLKLVPGVEIKRVLMVAPSSLPGFVYKAILPGAGILPIPDYKSLLSSLLSEIPRPAEPPGPGGAPSPGHGHGEDLVSRIKAGLPVKAYASRFTELRSSDGGRGRWFVGRCPLPQHEDRNPSFWVDAKNNLWGCHGCGVRGDVINLHARLEGLTLQAAIKDLAQALEVLEGVCS